MSADIDGGKPTLADGGAIPPATGWPDATALVLFAHGARDPRWAEPLNRLADVVRAQRPDVAVVTAFLELMQPDLPAVLDGLAADGHVHVNLMPVFWSAGGHVIRDLPVLIADSRLRNPGLNVAVLPVLSELPGVLDAVARAAWPAA
ncbi:cobalamin biosynthesis protein CbiX [Pigmentiphaga aceris]|uniref:Cobalamin biosynthesis protein CbiX n=1 Tax=Pigmentiphaga aceris TaxID=1940612 RepID=A0A5C0AVJ4_9BURK|nr:CbiX/SirB N-terminal domain-containing protein [Pigmentiphaga aceris]QEI04681.1 cobalamin biosynthesis protein CbiX [Pigmentiphaga aceris]